eukprot:499566-Hanusia_phi.AAC.4
MVDSKGFSRRKLFFAVGICSALLHLEALLSGLYGRNVSSLITAALSNPCQLVTSRSPLGSPSLGTRKLSRGSVCFQLSSRREDRKHLGLGVVVFGEAVEMDGGRLGCAEAIDVHVEGVEKVAGTEEEVSNGEAAPPPRLAGRFMITCTRLLAP